ncbi:MAG: hypothetical protein QOK47_383 [Actinomycetota bacterium]|nr:hypothetical protein [Actinomycetota bacterium]
MIVVRWIGFAFGLTIVFLTIGSLLRTLVVPRGITSRLSVWVGRRIVYKTFLMISNRFDTYEAKDKILAFSAPSALLAILIVWMFLVIIGYGFMIWPIAGISLLEALRESGSSVLTLGFASHAGLQSSIIYFIAAFTGLIIVALQIAYLPTIYAAFNRRETLVTMLQSRAGTPAWGPEILARHQMVGLTDDLPRLYAEWERWCAEVMESQTTYTVLNFFRSPHPLRSWILALLAVLDSSALYLSLMPSSAPTQARLALRMGFTCLRSIADVLAIPYDPDPFPDDPIELTYEEFLGGVKRLTDMGLPLERTPEEAWPHFKGWRVNYESIAYGLADVVVAPPGPWSGPRSHLPGMTIAVVRPPNRRPDDPEVDRPKATRAEHI